MKREIEEAIAAAVKELFAVELLSELTRPDAEFGDYATNVALQLAGQLQQNPRAIAEQLAAKLQQDNRLASVSVAGPGFLNLRLDDDLLREQITAINEAAGQTYGRSDKYQDQVIVAEYSDPNPFKVLHAGHLYTSVVGDSIANLLAFAGGAVHRVNFGGDVGMHVGKTMWAILQRLGGENPARLEEVAVVDRPAWMAAAYVEGNNLYDEDEAVKAEMVTLNKQVYALHNTNDHESALAQIYWTCRQWSYDYFDEFYAQIGTTFEKYYPESETAGIGLETVRQHIGKVFEESDGAVVFKGEPYGLHTRVFINREGLPTYEAKDVGLIMKKKQDYNFDKSVVITGNEQEQYMAVVLKAIEQFAPELSQATTHLTHGIVKLAGGVKMSSRKGNILRAVDVLEVAAQANQQATGKDDPQVTLGAVKYAFLKQRLGGDIVYDPAESVALQGNSGPYLQYAYVRARSIISKMVTRTDERNWQLEPGERRLLFKLTEYPEVIDKAVNELAPHIICTYLYELAQTFNRFYEDNRVIGDPREPYRLLLVTGYAGILQSGLQLLGMATPEHM